MEIEAMVSLVTNTGLAEFVTALVATNAVKHIGWGTGSGQGVTSTNLATPAAEARTSGTPAAATTSTTDDTYRVTGTIVATGTRAITEVGVFDAATGAVMRIYGDFSVINLVLNDSIAFTIDVVLDQA
jgi:hypothetical protein